MKNSNKKTIAMALLISAVISPVGKEAFAAEPTPTETIGNQNTSDQKNTDQLSNEPGTSGEYNVEPKVEDTNQPGVGGSETTQDDQKTEDVTDGDGPQTLEKVETPTTYAVSESSATVQSHRLYIKDGNAQSWEFYKYKPEDPENTIKLGDYDKVEDGYLVKGVIKLNPRYLLNSKGLKDIPRDKYTISIEGEGLNTVATYTFNDIVMDKPITIEASGSGTNQVNFVSYNLDGGTWERDKTFTYLTPGKTIDKPTDPTKEGYIFKGWSGTSTLTSPTNDKVTKTYTKDNPYDFNEVYPVDPEYQWGDRRVSLKAIWERDEDVEILGKHEFKYTKPDTVDEIYFKATNPDNPNETIEIPIDNAKVGESVPLTKVPAGWKLEGKIKMKPTYLIYGTGDSNLPISAFNRTAEGEGDQRRWVYTLPDGYKMPNSSVWLNAWQSESFNHADFNLNGGKWDETPVGFKKYENSNIYYTLILPEEKVRRPQDPKRDGYDFIGWSGTSKLTVDPETGTNNVAKEFTADNPYTFDEKDNLPAVGVERLKIVKLKAEWKAKQPTFDTENVTIKKGESVSPESLIKSGTLEYNDDDVNQQERKVEIIGDYDNKKPDNYPVKVKVTNGVGGVTEKDVVITVTSDADDLEPKGKTQAVRLNTTPEAKNSIDNVDSLPEGTEFAYKDPVDTSSTGDKSAVVVVTYPDGSKEEVEVIVRVVSDSDSNGSSENNSEVPNQDETNKPSTGNSETNDNNPSIPGTPGKDQPEINYPIIPDYTDEDEKVVVPSPDENKPELPSTENTVTPDKSEESEDQDTSKKPEDTVKPGTPDKTENSDDIEESGEQETTDGKDDGDKVIVPTPDNKKPEDSEESGTTDKKDDDGKIRVPSINKDNEPDDRHSSSKIKQSSESSIISADDNNTGTNVTRSPRSGHDNVQTGVSGAIGVASILAAASLGLAATKKKEDEEE